MLSLKYFKIILIVLLFMPGFCFNISNLYYPYFNLFLPIFLIIYLVFGGKKILKYLYHIYKKTPMKYFIYFIIAVICSGLICVFKGYYSFNRFLYAILAGLILRGLFVYLFPVLVIKKNISLKKFIKWFVLLYDIVLLIGLIEVLGYHFNISLFSSFVSFISNTRSTIIYDTFTNSFRLRSTFTEPSVLAAFLCFNLPIILNLQASKYRIFRNKYLNFILKKSLLPLTLIVLFLTQSPIFIIISLGVLLYFYKKQCIKLIKKYYLFILIPLLLLILIIVFLLMFKVSFTNYFTKTFIFRILNTIATYGNWDMFVLVESSLATRIASYRVQFNIFCDYPLFGVGYGNRGPLVMSYFYNAKFALTVELLNFLYRSVDNMAYNTTAFYQILHQSGIFAAFFYLLFVYKTLFSLKKIYIYFNNIERTFVSGYFLSMLILLFLSIFYAIGLMNVFLLFYLGLSASILNIARQNQKNNKLKNEMEDTGE